MRVLVVGAGAVGGFFGGRLAAAGVDVTFLVRAARADALRRDGLRLVSPDGAVAAIPVVAVTADELNHPWDVVLLSVKATAIIPALDDVGAAIGPDTVVLPLLNGIGHLEMLTDRLGAHSVLGGVAVVATELDADGTVRQLTPGGSIALGELDGSWSERTTTIAELFAPADFATAVSDSIVQDMREKWAFMAAGGAATVLHGGPVGTIVAADGGLAAVLGVIAEVEAVLAATEHPVRPAAHDRTMAVLTAAGSPFTTSLYRDFVAGRPTEVEPILGDLVALAARVRVDVPRLHSATVRARVGQPHTSAQHVPASV
ncbi:2-dehydropantoate 2-reductase [Curtobacterium sp. USHLN213]|uniref:2-dehydropantoate 2-reductase n=1 Tax=Curtobacterium sp. USHLN213 TaxID=3081255 RepID=UPI0030190C6B